MIIHNKIHTIIIIQNKKALPWNSIKFEIIELFVAQHTIYTKYYVYCARYRREHATPRVASPSQRVNKAQFLL